MLRRFGLTGRTLVIAVPWIWLLLFFLIPFIIVLKISFAETRWLGTPPYSPLFGMGERSVPADASSTSANYLFLLHDSLYLKAFLSSLKVAAISTMFCLLLGYPMAYAIARADADVAQHAAAADHPAVLDVVPAARVRVDRIARQQRARSTRC